MNFRQRLALFLIVTLIGVQGLTAFFAYNVVRNNLVEGGKRELTAASAVFMRQLNVLSEGVADGRRKTLSLDYALALRGRRPNDRATALSALKNHGNRIGATRMMLVGLDGTINADTAHPDSSVNSPGRALSLCGAFSPRRQSGEHPGNVARRSRRARSTGSVVGAGSRAVLPIGFIAA